MQITGNIIQVSPLRSGTSSKGTQWQSLDFLVEVPGQYPRRVLLNIFGQDRINQLNPQQGEQNVTVDFDIDAHEYNGRFFNEIRAWNITRLSQQQPQTVYAAKQALQTAQAAPAAQGSPFPPPPPQGGAPQESALPF